MTLQADTRFALVHRASAFLAFIIPKRDRDHDPLAHIRRAAVRIGVAVWEVFRQAVDFGELAVSFHCHPLATYRAKQPTCMVGHISSRLQGEGCGATGAFPRGFKPEAHEDSGRSAGLTIPDKPAVNGVLGQVQFSREASPGPSFQVHQLRNFFPRDRLHSCDSPRLTIHRRGHCTHALLFLSRFCLDKVMRPDYLYPHAH